ncbi:MAG: GNAT family N-acetyltransferase [Lachnospiraceae bacterium]|nr:GNAT family N-acetyltransferase [Lachnospiraceae bacterium]
MYAIRFPKEEDLILDKWVKSLDLDEEHLKAYDTVDLAFKTAHLGQFDTRNGLIEKLDEYLRECMPEDKDQAASLEKKSREWRFEMYAKKEDYEVRDKYNIPQLFDIEITEDLDSVLEEIMELDRTGYGAELGRLWYKGRYTGNCRIATARDKGKLIGYCLMAGITPELYGELVTGKHDDRLEIPVSGHCPISDGYHYLASVVVAPEYRRRKLAKQLTKKCMFGLWWYLTVVLSPDYTLQILKDFKFEVTDFGGNYKVAVRNTPKLEGI